MDSRVAGANAMLKQFAEQHVKLIDYCSPEILAISDDHLALSIPLNEHTKNHLQSMYFGALAIGADVAAGLLAMEMAARSGLTLSLAFKSVQGEFLRRPEQDVIFSCHQGALIRDMLQRCRETGERVNEPVEVVATCPSQDGDAPVARFTLTLSLKVVPATASA
ncbi:PaaI family thioesterase [Photobacterium atrarenae]|uniref:DUF4442 domain-containing protein n=1 Tax=Photobacterium atrarenae TaxID=865757 RepID=A0ABY5GI48_9GAMM|nr:DUF4442 domain-containing protein [Photobacterium atrarenae]UTV28799.1 DUF4442 domain-containing protein [Photobacterium atrarenae]